VTNRVHTEQVKDGRSNGRMIVICSAVGGAGRTAVTVNLAAFLAAGNVKTAIIDGDLQFGDIALALDLEPVVTMKEVIEQNAFNYIEDYFTTHETGLQVLAAPIRPEYSELITPDALSALADSMLAETDVLLVDTQHGLNEQSLSLMEKADQILVVTTPGMTALKNTKLMVETLEMLEMNEKIRLVVNKATAASVIKVSDIPGLTKVEQAYFLPEDSKHVSHSLDMGNPLVLNKPKHAFSKGIEKLAALAVRHQPTVAKNTAGGGILRKVSKKAKALKTRGDHHEFISQTAVKNTGASEVR
jgi:pilus assembly protein CpaE